MRLNTIKLIHRAATYPPSAFTFTVILPNVKAILEIVTDPSGPLQERPLRNPLAIWLLFTGRKLSIWI